MCGKFFLIAIHVGRTHSVKSTTPRRPLLPANRNSEHSPGLSRVLHTKESKSRRMTR
jgi:hypothetical protein